MTQQALSFRVRSLDVTGSTNDDVLTAAAAGEDEGLVITAKSQTGGRGRHGRSWDSPTGNLYASILLRPKQQTVAGSYGFVAALAIADALAQFVDRSRIRLKWPNDILVDDAKIGGILLEVPAGANESALVVGIGVNLAAHPTGVRYPTISLHSLGFALARLKPEDFLPLILSPFNDYHMRLAQEGFSALREDWLMQAAGLGEKITVQLPDSAVNGRFLTVDEQGCLLLQQQEGKVRRIAAGDVFFDRS